MVRAIIWIAVSSAVQATEDKHSLVTQEADARAHCERENWQIVDVLRVPGHSRHYVDIHECAADMLAAGIDAFAKLLDHWKARDFDVLITRDADRFARTQALHAYVVERTIQIGATIYSLADGEINPQNFRMWIAMGGYGAAQHIDGFQEKRKRGMSRLAQRGLPTAAHIIPSHRVVRDELGKAVKFVVHEETYPAFLYAAERVLEGANWREIAREVNERGFRHPQGRRWTRQMIRDTLFHPNFWGHSAIGFKTRRHGKQFGSWVFDESEPVPENVEIYRNTHDAAFTGDFAERLKTELRKRADWHGYSPTVYALSGIAVCEECGYILCTGGHIHRHHSYYCKNKDCTLHGKISEAELKAWISEHILPAAYTDGVFIGDTPAKPLDTAPLETALAKVTRRLSQLIDQKADAPAGTAALYDEKIHAADAERRAIQAQLGDLTRRSKQSMQRSVDRLQAFRAVQELSSPDMFWTLPEAEQQRILYRLFGSLRLTVAHHEVTGFTRAKRRRRTQPNSFDN